MKSLEIAGKKFKLASRAARTIALILDLVVTSFASSILVTLFSLLFIFRHPFNPIPMMLLSLGVWSAGLLFMDGFKNGQGFGKRALSLQVIRLKDGKPCSFKDSFIRRVTGFFQPFDLLFTLRWQKATYGR